MDTELNQIESYNVFTPTPLPPNRKPIGCRRVYTIKNDTHHKAKLVAKGYSQRHGLDFHDTWSPVPRFSTIRSIVALAAIKNFELDQMDVKCAYLNADIDTDIYMEVPPGMNVPSGYVLRLNKSLYGIRQGARLWHDKFSKSLFNLGFKQTLSDECVYIRGNPNTEDFIAIVVYVDDLLIIGSRILVDEFKLAIALEYEMKDSGASTSFIGFNISRERATRTIFFSQKSFTKTF
jgi:Reverse transcriptase (RNA-dependent DNA polymerase)